MPKGVTIALEWGDDRIQEAIWEPVDEAMAMLEDYATTRVRVDGQQADRRTQNLVWYGVEHAETPADWAKTTCRTRTGTSMWSSPT